MVKLFELSPVAKTLNSKSNKINTVIEKINGKLLSLNLGIEVWIELTDTGLSFDPGDNNNPASKYRLRDLLGYVQCGKDWTWQLAVRQEKTLYVYDQDEKQEEEMCEPGATMPLLTASREIRIAAMQNIEGLLTKLKQRGDHIIKTIDEAEAVAESL